jgi:mono/diheme cytochrome c family protein
MNHPSKYLIASALTVAWLAGLGCEGSAKPSREWRPEDHGQPPESMRGSQVEIPPARSLPGTARERALAALFQVHCASCHGAEGHGDGPARAPVMQLPDFTSAEWQASRSDTELAQAIARGRGMMPPFGDRIAEENIEGLVERVRAFAPKTEAEPAEAAPTEAEPAEAAPTEAEPAEAEPTEAVPAEAEPAEQPPAP